MTGIKDLSYWLRKSPQPVSVLVDDKKIDVPRNRRAWRDLKDTIVAMDPAKLTCLDGQGNVIRAITFNNEDEDKPAPASPEMSDLQLFATLLERAYDKASSKMQPVVDSAMAFVERGGQRLAKVENENDRLRALINKQNQQIAELTGAIVPEAEDGIMGALVAGVMQGQQAAATQQVPPSRASAVTPIKEGAKK